ncbi:hypothetical protein [Curtobacterium sp. Leaf261]|uniref:hypothetical protein n=1 Tax=Curtobacterium sp. Leaf261 TaxID=1736311 RepID=UPI0006FDD308|nr:hypothetical protein [Curtobacterium sp. Leaf261]KQO63645.1 hypothetical protein ASF23_05290 [Curtobacterium sp. Leaf261]
MIRLRRLLRLDAMQDERGMALAIAIIFGTVIVFMVATAVTVATSGIRKSVTDADWNGSLSAAYAGIQDYEARLSNDTGYTQYGNPSAPFSASSAGLLTLPPTTNDALGTGASGSWASVPDTDGTAKYRYEVDASKYYDTGIIRVRATGKVNNAVRTVTASIRQQGFIDFLYFTDFEIQDPQITGANVTNCVKHAWEGTGRTRQTSANPNPCGEIAFGGGDKIDGPAHSNDTMRICDAQFTSQITTSNPNADPTTGLRYSKVTSQNAACSGQVFPAGVSQPAFTSTIPMPSTNAQQKAATRYDLATNRSPGCLYTGPTDIVFNANGTMTVKSPNTLYTQTANDDSSAGQNTAACGTPAQLKSPAGATITVPANNLVYVQNVPSSPTDKNYTSTTALRDTCNQGNGVGYPRAGETTSLLSSSPCSYGSRNGDAFVRGDFSGQLTVAAENSLYVTGDIDYQDKSSDILGLTATNAISVYNPMKASSCGFFGTSTCYSSLLADTDREIDAAVISAAHTFQVQNSAYGGGRGTLTLYGAIAQKFRGVVSTNGNGYIKNYVYDSRLKHTAPPKFLNPVTTTYGITTIAEVSPAYNVNGSCVQKSGVCV